MANETSDYICLISTSIIMVSYHIWFIQRIISNPHNLTTGYTFYIRRQWVRDIRSKPGAEILAVQTLRNWILVSTFLASVAVTISFTAIQIAVKIMDTDASRFEYFVGVDLRSSLLGIKTIIVVICNFVSFIGFTQSIRYFNHVGFAIQVASVSQELTDMENSSEQVAKMLNLGALFFTMGIRGFYFAVPFIFWFISPWAMLITSVVMLTVIYYSDGSGVDKQN